MLGLERDPVRPHGQIGAGPDRGRKESGMEAITIRPLDREDWTLERRDAGDLQHFRNGAGAEAAAKRLAETLADAGQCSKIVICWQDGAPRSRFVSVLT
jgi:hypothetical protein